MKQKLKINSVGGDGLYGEKWEDTPSLQHRYGGR